MKIRAASYRAIDVIFALAMIALYGSLGGGIAGVLDTRIVSLIVLVASAVGGAAVFALLLLSRRELLGRTR